MANDPAQPCCEAYIVFKIQERRKRSLTGASQAQSCRPKTIQLRRRMGSASVDLNHLYWSSLCTEHFTARAFSQLGPRSSQGGESLTIHRDYDPSQFTHPGILWSVRQSP